MHRLAGNLAPYALTIVLLAVGASAARAGGTYTVDRFDDVLNADQCFDAVADDCSLRGAIRRSNLDSVDTIIILPDGLYQLTLEGGGEDANTTGDLDVRSDGLTLMAAPGAHPVIQDLNGDRIFHIDPSAGDIVFTGPLTLLEGDAFNAGGAQRGGSLYFLAADSLTLTDVHFQDGFATDAGGCLYVLGPPTPGSLNLTDVTFSGCGTEDTGGGFFLDPGGSTVELDRLAVRDCFAGVMGGGGYFEGGTTVASITRSVFEHNTAAASFTTASDGGGLFLDGGTYEIAASTFAHNTAGRPGGVTSFGGGIAIVSGGLLLGNSTLSENRVLAPTAGGADLSAESSSLGLQFSTVKALAAGPPVSIELSQNSSMQVFASLFSADCAGGSITSAGFNAEYPQGGAVTTQCDLDHVADVLSTEPLLRPLAGYGGPTPTHALLPDAEATTFLLPSGSCVDSDQRGAERLSLFCHSGAYEANATPPGPWLFSDGFESGGTAAWSAAVPEPEGGRTGDSV